MATIYQVYLLHKWLAHTSMHEFSTHEEAVEFSERRKDINYHIVIKKFIGELIT